MCLEGLFLFCLGLSGFPLPLVTSHSNHPKEFIEHLLHAQGMNQASSVPTKLTI